MEMTPMNFHKISMNMLFWAAERLYVWLKCEKRWFRSSDEWPSNQRHLEPKWSSEATQVKSKISYFLDMNKLLSAISCRLFFWDKEQRQISKLLSAKSFMFFSYME